MRFIGLLNLVAVVALADVAPRPADVLPARDRNDCERDDQCVIRANSGCCSCCQGEPEAFTTDQARQMQMRCAAVDCAHDCETVKCARPRARPADFRAVCRQRHCEKVPVAAPPPPPPPPPTDVNSCVTDSECTLTDYSCCTGCCEREVYATTPRALAASRRACATKSCPAYECAAVQHCRSPAPASSFSAICEAGRCQRVVKNSPPPSAQCRQNSDCQLAYPRQRCEPGCGCCQSPQAIAFPSGRAPPDLESPERNQVVPGQPAFGLSTGDAKRCGSCPPVIPADAVCNAGQCMAVPKRVRLTK